MHSIKKETVNISSKINLPKGFFVDFQSFKQMPSRVNKTERLQNKKHKVFESYSDRKECRYSIKRICAEESTIQFRFPV